MRNASGRFPETVGRSGAFGAGQRLYLPGSPCSMISGFLPRMSPARCSNVTLDITGSIGGVIFRLYAACFQKIERRKFKRWLAWDESLASPSISHWIHQPRESGIFVAASWLCHMFEQNLLFQAHDSLLARGCSGEHDERMCWGFVLKTNSTVLYFERFHGTTVRHIRGPGVRWLRNLGRPIRYWYSTMKRARTPFYSQNSPFYFITKPQPYNTYKNRNWQSD